MTGSTARAFLFPLQNQGHLPAEEELTGCLWNDLEPTKVLLCPEPWYMRWMRVIQGHNAWEIWGAHYLTVELVFLKQGLSKHTRPNKECAA